MSGFEDIREGMEVIGADGVHVGTVDRIEGNRIKLTRKDSGQGSHEGHHHFLAKGLVAEVEGLRTRYALNAALPSMRAVGYRQVWETLEGAEPESTLADRGIAATRQLAKRQLTWLRAMPDVVRLDCLDAGAPVKSIGIVGAFLGRMRPSA